MLSRAALRVARTAQCSSGVRALSTPSWDAVPMGPTDPIFGLTLAYNADTNPNKINLGVGAYRTDDGKPLVLNSVRAAEKRIAEAALDHEYAGIGGVPEFVDLTAKFALGEEHDAIKNNTVGAIQTISGTGALCTAGHFVEKFVGTGTPIYVSSPTWGNHTPIFRDAGLNVQTYRYYDAKNIKLDFAAMCDDILAMPKGAAILLQACAHNPTGIDPTQEQWRELSDLIKKQGLYIIFDNAYQGFASGDPEKDAFAIRHFVDEGHEPLVCQSYSKNFGLYGERAGVVAMVAQDTDRAQRALSQLKIIVRPMYSNPPINGARIVSTVLRDPELTQLWRDDCLAMAERIHGMRTLLRESIEGLDERHDWSHITQQIGMFAFSGLNPDQVKRLREEFSIYMTGDGRISVAGITTHNVGYLAESIHKVSL